MTTCPDCGCRTRGGICSSCQEELYIGEYQSEFIDYPLSKEFQEKAAEQREYLDKQPKEKRNKKS